MKKFNLRLQKIIPEEGLSKGYYLACSFEELYLQIIRPDMNHLAKKLEDRDLIFTDVYFKTISGKIYRIYKAKSFFSRDDWILIGNNLVYHFSYCDMYYGRLKIGESFIFGIHSITEKVTEILCVDKGKFCENIANLPESYLVKEFLKNLLLDNIYLN